MNASRERDTSPMPEQSTTPDVVEILRRSAEIGGRLFQRGRSSRGAGRVQFRHASVSTWVNGLIERVTLYTDIDEAAAERLAKARR
jgi:hypothetical protein